MENDDNLDPAVIAENVDDAYGPLLHRPSVLSRMLEEAKEQEGSEYQVILLEFALKIARGIGSFTKHSKSKKSSWDTRQ